MTIAIAAFLHESNTFSSSPTTRSSFEAGSLTFGPDVVERWKDAHHEVAGFIEGAERWGFDIEPILAAWATPSGPVDEAVIDEITQRIITHMRRASDRVSGLLLALHGAMASARYPDADGETLRRLREALQPGLPIVVTLDLHANVSSQMVQNCDAIVMYQTNPHVDQRARGCLAASLMARQVAGEIHPTQALAKPANIIGIACQNTSQAPLLRHMQQARLLEDSPGVLCVNLSAGFPYADVPEMGPSVVVVTDDDFERAQREAQRLSDALWQDRHQLVRSLPDAAEAVRRAFGSSRRPVLLIEFGDNIGGGSPGDSTILLAELLRQRAAGSLVILYDPHAVQQACQAGLGQQLELTVGGKTDRRHGDPVPVRALVRSIHEGKWIESQARHGGMRFNDQGPTVVLEVGVQAGKAPMLLVLNSKRTPPFSLGQITSLGIDPAASDIIVVKAAVAYRAAYEPIAGEVIEVDTPGMTANDPRLFRYEHVRRPMYPLDEI